MMEDVVLDRIRLFRCCFFVCCSFCMSFLFLFHIVELFDFNGIFKINMIKRN